MFARCLTALGALVFLASAAPARAADPAASASAPVPVVPAPPANAEARARDENQARAQHRREMEDLDRQDAAAALAGLGVRVDWRTHTRAELAEWRARAEAAHALRAQFGIGVDWRQMSLRELRELRLRAAKAAELGAAGINVDWTRFTWRQLEQLRRTVTNMHPGSSGGAPTASEGSASPALAPRGPGADPGDRLIAPSGTSVRRNAGRRGAEDAILEPTFTADSTALWHRPRPGVVGRFDADAVLVPTFTPPRRPYPPGRDDVINPWQERFQPRAFAGRRHPPALASPPPPLRP